jgi:hypothetical protein
MLAHAYAGINIVFLWEFSFNWRFSENPKYKLTLLSYMSFNTMSYAYILNVIAANLQNHPETDK